MALSLSASTSKDYIESDAYNKGAISGFCVGGGVARAIVGSTIDSLLEFAIVGSVPPIGAVLGGITAVRLVRELLD